MVLKLLPVQVEIDLITEATSSIITPEVVKSFAQAAGDFTNVAPFCLLTARASFIRLVMLFTRRVRFGIYETIVGTTADDFLSSYSFAQRLQTLSCSSLDLSLAQRERCDSSLRTPDPSSSFITPLNQTDYDENLCRAVACEMLARRIIHSLPADKLQSVMRLVLHLLT